MYTVYTHIHIHTYIYIYIYIYICVYESINRLWSILYNLNLQGVGLEICLIHF